MSRGREGCGVSAEEAHVYLAQKYEVPKNPNTCASSEPLLKGDLHLLFCAFGVIVASDVNVGFLCASVLSHTDTFATNEDNMTNFKGNVIQDNPSSRHLVLDDSPSQPYQNTLPTLSTLTPFLKHLHLHVPLHLWHPSYELTDPESLAEHLTVQQNVSNFAISVGSTTYHSSP